MKFLPLIVLICIVVLSIYISRNNYKKRYIEICTNLKNYNIEIKKYYYSMEKYKQEKFFNMLSPYWKPNFLSILDDNFKYANNMWALQKQIDKQQELFSELTKFNEKNKTHENK